MLTDHSKEKGERSKEKKVVGSKQKAGISKQ